MSAPHPATINRFLDVKTVLDAALAQRADFGETCGVVPMPTRGAAIHWRQRAYKFMKLFRETRDANSPYERLSFPQIPSEEPTGGWNVIIKMAGKSFTFVPTGPTPVEDDDPLFDIAKSLASKIEEEGL